MALIELNCACKRTESSGQQADVHLGEAVAHHKAFTAVRKKYPFLGVFPISHNKVVSATVIVCFGISINECNDTSSFNIVMNLLYKLVHVREPMSFIW